MTSSIKKNRLFKFMSSVKLAVPTMLILGFCVAIGTVLESRYNADYARLLIYQSPWFYLLLVLLWLNILFAALSRIPFNKNHTGFVITHIGLLVLLGGSFVTARWGIDGQLMLQEGQSGNNVVLSDYVIELKNVTTQEKYIYDFTRSAYENNPLLKFQGGIEAIHYLPFAESKEIFKESPEGAPAVEFKIKSPFFKVSDTLQLKDKPVIKMGPATFRLFENKIQNKSGKNILLVLNSKTSEVLGRKNITQVGDSFEVGEVKITIKKILKQAIVQKNNIIEGNGSSQNPAIDLEIQSHGKTRREISYALFPDFTLHAEPPFGLKFHYVVEDTSAKGNVIDLVFNKETPKSLKVIFSKNNELINSKDISVGQSVESPWMGMELSILSSLPHTSKEIQVSRAPVKEKADLPPPAVLFQIGKDTIWLIEGDSATYTREGVEYILSFTKKSLTLPFNVTLNKFEKKDYPGTATPMSFESTVSVDGSKEQIISMNEPLKNSGYTVYQSSFVESPGEKPYSIFSINKDPGRPIKYIGSFILGLGIIIFTVMRSGRYKKWMAGKK